MGATEAGGGGTDWLGAEDALGVGAAAVAGAGGDTLTIGRAGCGIQ